MFLIGIDGLGWDLLEELIRAGRAPNLARLRQQGAWGELETLLPTWSPRIWNTAFTGRMPEDHGIEDFSSVQFPRLGIVGIDRHRSLMIARPVLGLFDSPQRVPASSLNRRVKAIRNLASEADLEVAVVGGWASYPAEAVNGALVSDHAFYRSQEFAARKMGRWQNESDRFVTYPEELNEELTLYRRSLEDVGPEAMERFVTLGPDDRATFRGQVGTVPRPGEPTPRLRLMTWAVLNDDFYTRTTLHLLERSRPDFLFTYFGSVDSFGHMVWEFSPTEAEHHQDPEDLQRFGDSMNRVVQWVDERVGEILTHADEQTSIVVISDHSWEREEDRDGTPHYGHHDAPPGILIAAGHGVRAAGHIEGAHIADVAPTVLYLLGLPLAEELSGSLLVDLIDPELLRNHPPQRIASYGAERTHARAARSGRDDVMIERLKALGYVE